MSIATREYRSRKGNTYIAIVGGRHNILKLLAGEDVDTDEVTLCVTVLPGLRGRNLNHLCKIARGVTNNVNSLTQDLKPPTILSTLESMPSMHHGQGAAGMIDDAQPGTQRHQEQGQQCHQRPPNRLPYLARIRRPCLPICTKQSPQREGQT